MLSTGDTAERVDFFVCKVGDIVVRGQFGEVNFADGDVVEALGVRSGRHFDVLAITRPSDRTIWMHPHCGRGSRAYWRFSIAWVFFVSWVIAPLFFFFMDFFLMDLPASLTKWALIVPVVGLGLSLVFGFVVSRFAKFSHLSNDIFRGLEFENPEDVDLPKRLREASKAFTVEERFKCHPHARWVYKY